MPKKVHEIKKFLSGTITTPDAKDIPEDAAQSSLNIDPTSSSGRLKGINQDVNITREETTTEIITTITEEVIIEDEVEENLWYNSFDPFTSPNLTDNGVYVYGSTSYGATPPNLVGMHSELMESVSITLYGVNSDGNTRTYKLSYTITNAMPPMSGLQVLAYANSQSEANFTELQIIDTIKAPITSASPGSNPGDYEIEFNVVDYNAYDGDEENPFYYTLFLVNFNQPINNYIENINLTSTSMVETVITPETEETEEVITIETVNLNNLNTMALINNNGLRTLVGINEAGGSIQYLEDLYGDKIYTTRENFNINKSSMVKDNTQVYAGLGKSLNDERPKFIGYTKNKLFGESVDGILIEDAEPKALIPTANVVKKIATTRPSNSSIKHSSDGSTNTGTTEDNYIWGVNPGDKFLYRIEVNSDGSEGAMVATSYIRDSQSIEVAGINSIATCLTADNCLWAVTTDRKILRLHVNATDNTVRVVNDVIPRFSVSKWTGESVITHEGNSRLIHHKFNLYNKPPPSDAELSDIIEVVGQEQIVPVDNVNMLYISFYKEDGFNPRESYLYSRTLNHEWQENMHADSDLNGGDGITIENPFQSIQTSGDVIDTKYTTFDDGMLFRDNSIIFDTCTQQSTFMPKEGEDNDKKFYTNSSIEFFKHGGQSTTSNWDADTWDYAWGGNTGESYLEPSAVKSSFYNVEQWEFLETSLSGRCSYYNGYKWSTRATYEATQTNEDGTLISDDGNGSITGTSNLEYAIPDYDTIDLNASMIGRQFIYNLEEGVEETNNNISSENGDFHSHFFDLGWNLGFEGDANDTFKLNIHRFGLIGLENKIDSERSSGQTSINETPVMYMPTEEHNKLGDKSCFVGLLAQCDQPYVLYGGNMISIKFLANNSSTGNLPRVTNGLFCHQEGITQNVSNGFIMSICSGERYWDYASAPKWRNATGSLKKAPKVKFEATTFQKGGGSSNYDMEIATSCIPFMSGIYQQWDGEVAYFTPDSTISGADTWDETSRGATNPQHLSSQGDDVIGSSCIHVFSQQTPGFGDMEFNNIDSIHVNRFGDRANFSNESNLFHKNSNVSIDVLGEGNSVNYSADNVGFISENVQEGNSIDNTYLRAFDMDSMYLIGGRYTPNNAQVCLNHINAEYWLTHSEAIYPPQKTVAYSDSTWSGGAYGEQPQHNGFGYINQARQNSSALTTESNGEFTQIYTRSSSGVSHGVQEIANVGGTCIFSIWNSANTIGGAGANDFQLWWFSLYGTKTQYNYSNGIMPTEIEPDGGNFNDWIESSSYPLEKQNGYSIITFSSKAGTSSDFAFDVNSKLFYAIALVYDNEAISKLTKQEWFFDGEQEQADNTIKFVKLHITLRKEDISKRVTGMYIFRRGFDQEGENANNYTSITDFIPLYEGWTSVTFDDGDGNDIIGYRRTIYDREIEGGQSYEYLTGLSHTSIMEHVLPNYELSTVINNYNIIAKCSVPGLGDLTNYIYKSNAGVFNVFQLDNDDMFIKLPTTSTAIVGFQGRLYAFDENNAYVINIDGMLEEDRLEGIGCKGKNSVVVTEHGMFVADNSNIYQYDGSKAIPLANAILTSDNNVGWLDKDSDFAPILTFDGGKLSLLAIFKSKNINQYFIWSYSIILRRWDRWDVPIGTPLSAISGKDGEPIISTEAITVFYSQANSRRAWQWVSKAITLGQDTKYKKFYKVNTVSNARNPNYVTYKLDNNNISNADYFGTGFNIDKVKAKTITLSIDSSKHRDLEVDSLSVVYRDLPNSNKNV